MDDKYDAMSRTELLRVIREDLGVAYQRNQTGELEQQVRNQNDLIAALRKNCAVRDDKYRTSLDTFVTVRDERDYLRGALMSAITPLVTVDTPPSDA